MIQAQHVDRATTEVRWARRTTDEAQAQAVRLHALLFHQIEQRLEHGGYALEHRRTVPEYLRQRHVRAEAVAGDPGAADRQGQDETRRQAGGMDEGQRRHHHVTRHNAGGGGRRLGIQHQGAMRQFDDLRPTRAAGGELQVHRRIRIAQRRWRRRIEIDDGREIQGAIATGHDSQPIWPHGTGNIRQ